MSSRHILLSCLVACGLFGCAADPVVDGDDVSSTDVVLSGELSYLPRIALPPAAEAVLELRAGPAPSGEIIAEARTALQGRQVPVPFALEVDPSAFQPGRVHVFRASLVAPGERAWISEPVVIESEPRLHALGTLLLERTEPRPVVQRLECGERSAEVTVADDAVVLNVDGARIDLEPVEAASGARYRRPGDARTEFWSRGDRARLRVGGEDWPECRALPAERVLVARGNEPGWRLDLDRDTLTLSWDYGAGKLAAATPEAVRSERLTSYGLRVGERRLAVAVHDRLCSDDMTGMPYPQQVIVSIDDRSLRGCGGNPQDLLLGEWRVEDLDGRGVVDRSHATVVFSDDGRLGGRGSCNSYGGAFTLTGESLSVGQLHSTLMACAESLMVQEQRLFELLEVVQRFEIADDGALILHTHDGRSLTARR